MASMAFSRVVVIATVIFSFITQGICIQCFYCNSANNSACIDLTRYDAETRSRMIPSVNCNTAIPSAVAVDFFCRKIVQTIYHPRRESEVRVTRGCGWVRSHHDCYRADNTDHLETVCQCFEDHCNSSNMVKISILTLVVAVGSVFASFWY